MSQKCNQLLDNLSVFTGIGAREVRQPDKIINKHFQNLNYFGKC